MTQEQSLHVAQQHMRAAYQALRDSGYSGAAVLEHLQAILLDLWAHTNGLAAWVLWEVLS